jgi:hypothetical protein
LLKILIYFLTACPQINDCFLNIYAHTPVAKGEKIRGCMIFAQLAAKNRILRANAGKICTRVAAGRKPIAGFQNVSWQTIDNSYENN